VIRIGREEKVRLFVELERTECRLEEIKDNRVKLYAIRKEKQSVVRLCFTSQEKLLCFARAL
jgi:hypothetical protein